MSRQELMAEFFMEAGYGVSRGAVLDLESGVIVGQITSSGGYCPLTDSEAADVAKEAAHRIGIAEAIASGSL